MSLSDNTSFSTADHEFMCEALRLAELGALSASPNPQVGCVIVKDEKIIGRGFHYQAGLPHAEVYALIEADDQAEGATAYVTLEPCAHYGRTPPCAEALVKSGVARVVIATTDPNPKVAGKGIELLRSAGITVEVGLLKAEADWINRAFFTRINQGRPYVQLKLGVSLDGKIAMASGESQWITSSESRRDVQAYRAKTDLILSSSKTVIADQASLTVRYGELPADFQAQYPFSYIKQPIRLILDRQSHLTGKEKLFAQEGEIWLMRDSLPNDVQNTAIIKPILNDKQQIDLDKLLKNLGEREINSLWVEAGSTLAGALLEANLVDELILYYAPKILGHNAIDMCQLPSIHQLSYVPQFNLRSIDRIGDDFKVVLTKP